jgi:cyclopropane fatty-acyl-phospholipid synthase-like methyltransferase
MRTICLLILGLIACGPAPEAKSGHEEGEHAGPLVHRFDNADEWAKKLDDPSRDAWQRPADVMDAMHLVPGMTVVDLGAGTGYFEPWLSRAVGPSGRVIAIDAEPDMIRYLSERVAREGLENVETRLAPYDDPKLAPESVDRVLVVDTWHHLARREAYAAKLRTALRPGGGVVVVDFKLESKHGPPRQHRLPPEEVARELVAGDLTATVLRSALPEQYVVLGARPN